MIFDSVLETIGRTPMVRLRRVTVPNGSQILVKLEGFNPAGSIKDRTALSMVVQAERDGRLRPHGTIVESSSGNTGKGLALVGAAKGYRVILVTDPKAPRSMLDCVQALGAEIQVVDTPDENGYQGPRLERVRKLLAEMPDAFWPNQYDNPDNPRIHAEVTARELLADLPSFDALVVAVGTGGHISGLAETVKRELPDAVTIGVDAKGSAAFGFPYESWVMRGLGIAWVPGNLRSELVDLVHLVADGEGIATSRLLARTEGLLVGESAGAAVFAALHYAHQHPGSTVAVVAPDDGVNYLGESFDDGWLADHGLAEDVARLSDVESLVTAARQPAYPAAPLDRIPRPQLVTR
ncbi:cysteine synthase family protein [Actinomycetes bacterium KLBMP 9797]